MVPNTSFSDLINDSTNPEDDVRKARFNRRQPHRESVTDREGERERTKKIDKNLHYNTILRRPGAT